MVRLYKYLCDQKREYVLSKQVLRSGTSIGANIAKANGAISKNDFSSKMSIAYEGGFGNEFWLDLLKDSDYLDENGYDDIFQDVDEIAGMLFSVLKSSGRVRTVSSE